MSFAHACTMTCLTPKKKRMCSRSRARKRRRDAEKQRLESMLIHAQQVYDDAAAADAKVPPLAPPKPNEIRALLLVASLDVMFKRDGGNPEDMSIRDLITLLDKAMFS